MTQPHRVVAVAFDGMAPFELGIVVEVFGLPRPELEVDPWYELVVCSPDPSPLSAVGGIALSAERGVEALAEADTVIVPAWPRLGEPVPADLLDALNAAHARGARLVSICSGAFVLAATGLLDGRRAATHWRYAAALRRRHPQVIVDESVLYVDDSDVLTSAGSAAGIDLCVHLVRADHGTAIANQVARRLVVAPHREGGQAQFIDRPVPDADDDRVQAAMAWALEHLAEPVTVGQLAARAFMSPRTFTRQFRRAAGQSPMAWLVEQRVRASMSLLETTDRPVEWVGAASGFATPASYRRHFRRVAGVSPSQYRRAFAAGEPHLRAVPPAA
ncbi:MAG: transcriptional regulator FtrA [Actinomycetota bacterium]|nr:transcriptional regulator FtrA [Actinomycetota bacterium]